VLQQAKHCCSHTSQKLIYNTQKSHNLPHTRGTVCRMQYDTMEIMEDEDVQEQRTKDLKRGI
jgi:hypothetical protein